MAGGEIMAEADDLVDQERGRARRNPSRRGMLEQPALDLGTAGVERLFEERDHRTATRARIAAFGGNLVEPARHRAAVDDPAALVEIAEQAAPASYATNRLSGYSDTRAPRGTRTSLGS